MKRQVISGPDLPTPTGPYSPAIRRENLAFISSQGPIDPRSNAIAGHTVEQQARQVLENVKTILAAAGSSLESVLKVNVYLRTLDDFEAMNQAYREYFQEPYPARTTVSVSLPAGILVAADAIAWIDDETRWPST